MFQWLKGASARKKLEVDGWMREAYAHHRAGKAHEAEKLYRRILAQDPRHPDAQYLLGELAAGRGEHRAAATLMQGAIAANAGEPQFYFGLGCALQAQGDWEGAATNYRRALALDTTQVGAHLNLGCVLQERGEMQASSRAAADTSADLEEAVEHFRAATQLSSEHADAWLNLGYAMERQRNFEEAVRFYDRALAIDPRNAHAHFNRSMVLLAQGKTREGWGEYEWRWEASGYPRPAFAQPEWDGKPLGGKRLLLYTEQGFGDALQFARYASLAAERGAVVTLRCAPELVSLLGTVPGITRAVSASEPAPQFDVHCSLLSLPRVLADTEERASAPYIRAPERMVQQWRDEIPATEFKVGLVWASQPQNRIAPLKSAPLKSFGALAGVPRVRFYSLQKGEAAKEIGAIQSVLPMTDLSPRLEDFSDTAAVIANLDLVISVDTAVAHLAGAMGAPVWTLLPYARDWRWYPDEETSRWYRTMRLYGQTRRGDWSGVIACIADDLQRVSGASATSRT